MNNMTPLTLVIAGSTRTEILPDKSQVIAMTENAGIRPIVILAHPDMTKAWISVNGTSQPVEVVNGVCVFSAPTAVGLHIVEASHGLWATHQIPGVSFVIHIKPAIVPTPVPTPAPVPTPTPTPTPDITEISLTTFEWRVCVLSVWDLVNSDLNAVPPTVEWEVNDPFVSVMRTTKFYGFVHNHLFVHDGQYTATARISWPDGRTRTVRFNIAVKVNEDRLTQGVYVADDGSDDNVGTIEKPFKTIKKALSQSSYVFLRTGDTFTFDESLNIFGGVSSYGSNLVSQPVLKWTGPHHEVTWAKNLIYLKKNAYLCNLSIQTPFDYVPPTTKEQFNYEHDLTPRAIVCSGYNAVISCTAVNVGDFCNMNNGPSNCLFIGNSILDSLRCYMFWVQGSNHCFYFNSCNDSTFEHVSRFSDYSVVSTNYNNFKNQDKRGTQNPDGSWTGDKYNVGKGVQTRQKGVGHYAAYNTLSGPAGIGPLGRGDGIHDPGARTKFVVSQYETVVDVSGSTDPALTTPLEIWHGTVGFRIIGVTGPRLSFENTETQFNYPANRIIENGSVENCTFTRMNKLTTFKNVTIDASTTASAKAIS